MDYAEWTQEVTDSLVGLYGDQWRIHGGATTLPPNAAVGALAPFAGQPAAQYDNATYTTLFNDGQIDPNLPQVASPSGKVVYVVAPGLTDVPGTQSAWNRFLNATFTTGDKAASAVGLPSLSSIEGFLKDTGKQILIGVVVAAGVAIILKRASRGR